MSKQIIAGSKDLLSGEMKRCDVNGVPVALYNIEGIYYATSDICTHATASLVEGEIVDDDCISCPVHFGEFHIPTGQAVTFPCEVDLKTYLIEVDGDEIWIDLEQESAALDDLI